jgi:hypothetical protein
MAIFHWRSVLCPEYQPVGFCYAIRRHTFHDRGYKAVESAASATSSDAASGAASGAASDGSGDASSSYSPEGSLSIVHSPHNTPIHTFVHSTGVSFPGAGAVAGAVAGAGAGIGVKPMRFSLATDTHVVFNGERYLHGCVQHRFSASGDGVNSTSGSLRLVARARQFSAFILLVGKILPAQSSSTSSSPPPPPPPLSLSSLPPATIDEFEPSAACVVRNKEEQEIPLMLVIQINIRT